MSGILLSRFGLRHFGCCELKPVARSAGHQVSSGKASGTTTGQQWEGQQQGKAAGAWCKLERAADHRLQVAIGLYGHVSDYETVVLLSHRPVIFCTPVVQFVLAKLLGLR